MRRNVLALVIACTLFGIAFGVYELSLPLFLDDVNIQLEAIGLVLAAGAAANFLVVIYGGRLTDLLGRKGIYGGNLLVVAAATAVTPLFAHVAVLAVLKTVWHASCSLARTLRGVLVYESVPPERFTHRFGQLAGMETSSHALGFLIVGFVGVGAGAVLSYQGVFLISGLAVAVGAVAFFLLFRERYHPTPSPDASTARLTLRGLFARDLHPKLYLIMAAGFLAGAGFGVSHGLWTIYFRRQFDGPWATDLAGFDAWLRTAWPGLAEVWTAGGRGGQFALISLIAVGHRLLMGVPMFVIAPHLRRRLKGIYVGTMALQGLVMAGPAVADWLTGSFLLVAVLWAGHDLLGAAVWLPIHERYIQTYSRPAHRGADVARTKAVMVLGFAVGMAVAGPLMAAEPALPFLVGGVLVTAASAPLVAL
ncbi:MAG: MFS transporter [Phycisphaerae bacterium]